MVEVKKYKIFHDNSIKATQNHTKNLLNKNKCFNCLKPDIRYDEKHDLVYCFSCGIVIKQSLHDFTPPENINYTLLSDLSFI